MEKESNNRHQQTDQPTPPAPTYAAVPTPITPASSQNSLAIAAMVVGIIAVLFGWVPFLGFVLGVAAIIMGIIALKHKINKGMSIAGIATGAVAALWSIVVSFVLVVAFLGAASAGSTIVNEINDNLSEYTSEQQAKIDAKKDFAKGTTATFGDFEIKVNSVQRNYVPEDTYSQAEDGNELIVVNISVKNISAESAYLSSYNLGINVAGVTDTASYLSVDPSFDGGDISAGATTTGNIVYEINKDETDLKIQYEDAVFTTDDGMKTLTYTLAI